MTVNKIKNLREKRNNALNEYSKKVENIRMDSRLSESYINEKLKELRESHENEMQQLTNEIEKLIQEGKDAYHKKMVNAEFNDLDEKDLLKTLIIENRNRDLARNIVAKYKGKESELLEVARKHVKENTIQAPAYINALTELSNNDITIQMTIDNITKEYELNNLNSLQKDYLKLYNEVLEQEKLCREDRGNEAFKAKLLKYQ